MKKEKIELEYLLKSISINILWNLVGTAFGLSEWFANNVIVSNDTYTFTWNENEQKAKLLATRTNHYIRFQWDYDEGTDYYFEMRIIKHELTGDLSLMIIDFVDPEDKEDEISLWDKQIDNLCRKAGI